MNLIELCDDVIAEQAKLASYECSDEHQAALERLGFYAADIKEAIKDTERLDFFINSRAVWYARESGTLYYSGKGGARYYVKGATMREAIDNAIAKEKK